MQKSLCGIQGGIITSCDAYLDWGFDDKIILHSVLGNDPAFFRAHPNLTDIQMAQQIGQIATSDAHGKEVAVNFVKRLCAQARNKSPDTVGGTLDIIKINRNGIIPIQMDAPVLDIQVTYQLGSDRSLMPNRSGGPSSFGH